MFRNEKAEESPAARLYVDRMSDLLGGKWPINEFFELQPQHMGIGGGARSLWVEQHDQIEKEIATDLATIRALASKCAEHMARIAAVFTLIDNPKATAVAEEALAAFAGRAIKKKGRCPRPPTRRR